jgi:lysophospholipase L1-like esterase
MQRFVLPKPDSVFRVAILGGSNVYRLHDRLPELANRLRGRSADERRVEFLNFGGNAYGSHRLARIAAELVDYEPDLVVVYSGHNEFQEIEQLELVDLRLLALQRGLYRSALARFLRERLAQGRARQLRQEHNRAPLENPKVDFKSARRHEFGSQEVADRMDAYRKNLNWIVSICAERGVPVVVGTVSTNLWRPWLGPKPSLEFVRIRDTYQQGRYAEGMALADAALRRGFREQASSAENEIIRALAASRALPLADVESAIRSAEPNGVPGETLLEDRCHLNEAGVTIWLDTFEPILAAELASERN